MLGVRTVVQESVVAELRKQSSRKNDSFNALNLVHKKRGRLAAPAFGKDKLQREGKV